MSIQVFLLLLIVHRYKNYILYWRPIWDNVSSIILLFCRFAYARDALTHLNLISFFRFISSFSIFTFFRCSLTTSVFFLVRFRFWKQKMLLKWSLCFFWKFVHFGNGFWCWSSSSSSIGYVHTECRVVLIFCLYCLYGFGCCCFPSFVSYSVLVKSISFPFSLARM